MIQLKSLICGILFIFSTVSLVMGQVQPETRACLALPVDPIEAIIEAFKTYNVVALSDGTSHRCIPGHEFRLALLHDPRFPEVVDDIVVEFGSSLYQEVMDRFTSGEEVNYEELCQVWQKTTQTHGIWNAPIYEEFFRAVRKLNSTLPEDHKIRVLLGDPPVDHERQSKMVSLDQRDSYPAELIESEVIGKSRRVLVIYGGMHFLRRQFYFQTSDPLADQLFNNPNELTIVSILESKGIKVFSIWADTNDELISLQANVSSWKIPSLALVKDTVLGLAPFGTIRKEKGEYNFVDAEGQVHKGPMSVDPKRSGLIQEQFDAILVFGPRSSIKYSR